MFPSIIVILAKVCVLGRFVLFPLQYVLGSGVMARKLSGSAFFPAAITNTEAYRIRVILELCVVLAGRFDLSGWRQHEHVLRGIKSTCRNIARISSRKGPNYQNRLTKAYRRLLRRTNKVLLRAKRLCAEMESRSLNSIEICQLERLKSFIARTEQVCNTAERRVLRGERVPNAEKLFSLFEPHTQLYKRGKAGEPVQFGRLVLIYERKAVSTLGVAGDESARPQRAVKKPKLFFVRYFRESAPKPHIQCAPLRT